ncbi:MAG: methionyl-tRNA formyltransferase [Polyangiales bacterium]
MKIAFFGLPMAALALLQDGHEITLASLSRAGLPGTRRLRRALGAEKVLIKPRVDRAFSKRIDADLVVSWFWVKKLPLEVLRAAPLGGFGVHPSLLPRWRGPDPCFWAIDSGDEVTGVTAHRLDAEYDTGAILGTREVRVDPSWDSWRLARALDRPSLALLREIARMFAAGTPPTETEQSGAPTLAPEPGDELLALDFHQDVDSILRRIRAAAPYPGAWAFIGDEAVIVTRASRGPAPKALAPGEAAVVDGRAVVAAADGGVVLHVGRRVLDEEAEVSLDEAELAAIVDGAREQKSS